jgi:hypothetical protein
MMKIRYYVDATRTIYYKGEYITATSEEVAIAEYSSALQNGLINVRDSETSVDAMEDTDEERKQFSVV